MNWDDEARLDRMSDDDWLKRAYDGDPPHSWRWVASAVCVILMILLLYWK